MPLYLHSVPKHKALAIHSDLVNFKPCDFTNVSDELVRVILTDWKELLSRIYYPYTGSEHPPGFRDLLNYKMRLGKDAYVEPLTAFRGQPGSSKKFIPAGGPAQSS